MNDGYNGWANWETWNLNLWLQNDEFAYRSMSQQLRSLTEAPSYEDARWIAEIALGNNATPDGVLLDDHAICWQEIAKAMGEIIEENR